MNNAFEVAFQTLTATVRIAAILVLGGSGAGVADRLPEIADGAPPPEDVR